MAADSEFTPVVRRLGCLRGVSTLTAFALAVEIGDWHRFTGNSIGSFVGLVPAEYSSGASRVQGSITKTGNTHARRLLVEAAWHHRARYRARQGACATGGNWPRPAARARGDAGEPAPARPLGRPSTSAANAPSSPTSPSPANWPAGAGPWPSSRLSTAHEPASSAPPVVSSAWSDPRNSYEQPDPGSATLDS